MRKNHWVAFLDLTVEWCRRKKEPELISVCVQNKKGENNKMNGFDRFVLYYCSSCRVHFARSYRAKSPNNRHFEIKIRSAMSQWKSTNFFVSSVMFRKVIECIQGKDQKKRSKFISSSKSLESKLNLRFFFHLFLFI